MDNVTERHKAGIDLFGDDMSPAEIRQWFLDEEHGYYNLTANQNDSKGESENGASYSYRTFNQFHAFEFVQKRSFNTCLAFGCARGDDVEPLAGAVDSFIGIEPAKKFWRAEIGGKPATYLMPAVNGDLHLADDSVDLVTSLGVLHHVPNVSHLLGEFARVLKPGGMFIVREPCSSMGDWRKPRPGLTIRERGISLAWMDSQLRAKGFKCLRRRYVMFKATYLLEKLIKYPFNNRAIVVADWIASTIFSWNCRYWRDSTLKKIAPTSYYIVAQKVAERPVQDAAPHMA